MNPQQNFQEHSGEKVDRKFSHLNSVTPLSKYLSMILFVILPFVGGYLGYSFSPEKIIEKEIFVSQKDNGLAKVSTIQTGEIPKNAVSAAFDQVLKNETLGIQLRVPPKITAFAGLETKGCEQKLILGAPTETTIFLMPEKNSCDSNAELLTEFGSFEDILIKKIEIIPVLDSSEIAGIVKEKMANNILIDLSNYYSADPNDRGKCFFESLTVSIDEVAVGSQFGTLPVNINFAKNCGRLDPHILSVRYSPVFKKAIFIESTYGSGENGVYYHDSNQGNFDLDIYNSLELLH